MKYTKDFEMYWQNANKDLGSDFAWDIWNDMKIVSFRAWNAGINKTKRDYCLIKIREERETGRKLIQEMREKNA